MDILRHYGLQPGGMEGCPMKKTRGVYLDEKNLYIMEVFLARSGHNLSNWIDNMLALYVDVLDVLGYDPEHPMSASEHRAIRLKVDELFCQALTGSIKKA